MKAIFLTVLAISLSACNYNPKGKSIFFINLQRMTCREHKIIDAKPKLKFEFVGEYPIAECDGFISVEPLEFKEVQAAWESQFKKDK